MSLLRVTIVLSRTLKERLIPELVADCGLPSPLLRRRLAEVPVSDRSLLAPLPRRRQAGVPLRGVPSLPPGSAGGVPKAVGSSVGGVGTRQSKETIQDEPK